MDYTTLVASKSTAGSLQAWVNYSKLDSTTVLAEAQALIYSLLRTREMRADYQFTMTTGGAHLALPSGFLDPIGRIELLSVNSRVRQKDENLVQAMRNYTETSGTLGSNPFTTTSGSNLVNVALTGHGFNQDSLFYTTGASAFAGATIVGTFPVVAIVDANDFTIDITSLGTTPNASTSGGGAAVAYTCDNLTQGMPVWFGIWNETIYFDVAFSQACLCNIQYFKSLALLSATNTTNFLTNRYPHLLRNACIAAAADFMRDTEQYTLQYQRLVALVAQVNEENDMGMRGLELDPFIP